VSEEAQTGNVEAQREDELLMRYFDGELAGEQLAEVEARLQRDPDFAARLTALGNLQRAVMASAEHAGEGVDFDALFGRIEARVAQDAQDEAAQATPLPSGGLGQWLRELLQHPAQLFVPAAGLAAAAAVIFVVARSGPDAGGTGPGGEGRPQARTEPRMERDTREVVSPEVEPVDRKERMALASSEVVSVDFGDNTGTVFEIALAEGVSTPVVWINDEVEE
jgi:hypothetical protein